MNNLRIFLSLHIHKYVLVIIIKFLFESSMLAPNVRSTYSALVVKPFFFLIFPNLLLGIWTLIRIMIFPTLETTYYWFFLSFSFICNLQRLFLLFFFNYFERNFNRRCLNFFRYNLFLYIWWSMISFVFLSHSF